MGLRLSFGLGPVRASIPLSSRRRNRKLVHVPAYRSPAVVTQPDPYTMARSHYDMATELRRAGLLTPDELLVVCRRITTATPPGRY